MKRKYAYMFFLVAIGLILWAYTTVQSESPQHAQKTLLKAQIRSADDHHLILSIDPSEAEDALFRKSLISTSLGRRLRNIAMTQAISKVRSALLFDSVTLLEEHEGGFQEREQCDLYPLNGHQGGAWVSSTSRKRVKMPEIADPYLKNHANVLYTYFIPLQTPLPNGHYALRLPTGEIFEFERDCIRDISPLFKMDQVGYLPNAPVKRLYVGAWMGTGGALPIRCDDAKMTFEIVNAQTEQTVLKGEAQFEADYHTTSGTPVTGEETFCVDFSTLKQSGIYYCRIAKIGRSEPFEIRDDALADALYVQMRGLTGQRCGRTCHKTLYRGTFPPNHTHYGFNKEQDCGFHTETGIQLKVNHFELIQQTTQFHSETISCMGGWHDAADFDRRPQHLQAVKELIVAYLLNPNAFVDNQFAVPEQKNGIPDILDEAIWGLNCWYQLQNKHGGVPGWIETTRHPGEFTHPSTDSLVYYTSLITCESSLDYSSAAALLAYALRQAKVFNIADRYERSARQAWSYALNPAHRQIYSYTLPQATKSLPQSFTYREAHTLPVRIQAEAALNLFLLTQDVTYLKTLNPIQWKTAGSVYLGEAWKLSPAIFIACALSKNLPQRVGVADFAQLWHRSVMSLANTTLERMNRNPYASPWRSVNETFYETMAWGNSLPLNNARSLAIAWAISQDVKYHTALLQAINFHNGLNPLGLTYTTGLGRTYPVTFLHLFPNQHEAYPIGITPYRNVYGVPRVMGRAVFGINKSIIEYNSLIPALPRMNDSTQKELMTYVKETWPIERRWGNIEPYTVSSSEYTVWETLSPAIFSLGVALPPAAQHPCQTVKDTIQPQDYRRLPGYWNLP